ncbi:MAG: hypothetical protein J6T38_11440 [Bacteroidaceae bacterium]|nr:hypothetical protein [Bacteroidaceae bacterium]
MNSEDALDILGGAIVMCRSIAKALERVPLKDLLSIPVTTRAEIYENEYGNTMTQTKEYAQYACQNEIFEIGVVDISPVYDYLKANWPSNEAKIVRYQLDSIFQECLNLFEDPIIVIREASKNFLLRLHSPHPHTIKTVIYNTLHVMRNSLKMTGSVVIDSDERTGKCFELSEKMIYHIDWMEVTRDFDKKRIKDALITIGRNNKERMIIVEAIYEAAASSGHFSMISYVVDTLLDHLHKEYDDNHRGILFDYNERSERNNYYTFIERKRERIRNQYSKNYLGGREQFDDEATRKKKEADAMKVLALRRQLTMNIQKLELENQELLQDYEEDHVEICEEPVCRLKLVGPIATNLSNSSTSIINSLNNDENRKKETPEKCVKAVTKIITESITVNGTVLISQTQLHKAAAFIDLEKNTEIGILLVVCREVGIVKPSASNVDFVRALIGMGILNFVDEQTIPRIAHGFSDKINKMAPKHTLWSGNDRVLGNKLFEELRKV